MNNQKAPPTIEAPLNVLAGLYTEADPNDLPPGASPRVTNCDFKIGSTLPRPGKKSQYYFLDFFIERLCGFAQSVADGPNELAWSNPLNATHGIPGSYASVALSSTHSLVDGILSFDQQTGQLGTGAAVTTGFLTPTDDPEWALFSWAKQDTSGFIFTPDAGWLSFDGQTLQQIVNGAIQGAGTIGGAEPNWAASLALFKIAGVTAPTLVQSESVVSGAFGAGTHNVSFTNPLTAGNVVLVILDANDCGGQAVTISVSDGVNTYTTLVNLAGIESSTMMIGAFNVAAGSPVITTVVSTGVAISGTIIMHEVQGGQESAPSVPTSEWLQCFNFGYSIAETVGVIGFQVEVTGKQTDIPDDAVLTLKMLNPTADSPVLTFQLPIVEGTVTLGLPTDNWGFELSPDLLNDPNFGVQIQATSPTTPITFDISGVQLKVFVTPNPAPSFNYLKTFEQTAGEINNLFLDSTGIMWQENPLVLPGALQEVYAQIEPDTFAQSTTEDNREFIALSNLLNGTDIPYTYNGVNFDRCSQCGPGAAPTVTTTVAKSAIEQISQQGAVTLLTGPHDWLQCSDSPADIGDFGTPATPGNVFRIVFRSATLVPSYITPGSNIFLAGFPSINGNQLNNDASGVAAPQFYTVTAVGQPIPGELSYDAITFTVPFTTFYNQPTPGGCSFQSTTATMVTTVQVPNLEVGNQFEVSGTGGAPPAGYDNTWQVLTTPNAAQMEITSTQLVGNVATYGFVLQTGVAPVVGQAVTVTLTLNGNGVFNVANAIITSATAGSFSINLVSPNIASASETGAAIIFGNIFTFDAFAIIGTKLGGQVITSGIIGEGIRQACYSFLTRDGFITEPSPTVQFTVTTGASKIAVANLQPGPANVIARIIFFTAGNGANFYWIAEDVTVTDNGVNVVNTSTVVNDNTTTNATFSFSDAVLLGTAGTGGAADVQGSDYFETKELGSCVGFVAYDSRMFAIGEQNKVSNFRALSFDGGVGVFQSTAAAGGGAGVNSTYPLGWLVDPVNGVGGAMGTSAIFGFAYLIGNNTGLTKTTWGMIYQNAFQDQLMVPIIAASTTYSVRLAAAISRIPASGNLVVDLFSPALNRAVGTFTLPMNTMTTQMAIYTGTLLTTTLAPVPNDLILRVYAQNILTNVTIEIDRVEPFPTEKPNNNGQLIGSYQQDFEAFDRITGVIDGNTENQQSINAAFVLFDTLYMVKNKTVLAINKVAGIEPSQWGTPRTVSQACGTQSVYGVTTDDQGQEWAIIAGQQGAYLFTGGEPIPITEEIASLWNSINWNYGYTLQVRNDVINRRILIAVPLPKPKKDALGNYPGWYHSSLNLIDNPTTPNVILALSYKQLFTAGELADRIEVHASSYTGKLLTIDISRKWSIWTIKTPASAFIKRADKTNPYFVGNSDGTGKIYGLIDGLLEDDGEFFEQRYCTYGFVSTDQEQQLQIGSVRKLFSYKRILMSGLGRIRMNAYIDTLFSPYSTTLLPDLELPLPIPGDIEVPINETGERMFLEYVTRDVGSGFYLSKISLGLRQDPWSPVRGANS